MVLLGEAVDVAAELGELLGEVVGGEGLAAPAQRDRGARVGARGAADAEVDAVRGSSPASARNVSATFSGLWLGSMIPPEPTRSVLVALATAWIRISGLELATLGMPWCSASHMRR